MGKLKTFLLIVFLFAGASFAQAQWDAPFSQFWTVKTYYNPSFAGETDKMQVSGAYKLEWVGIDKAPTRYFAAVDMPVEYFGFRHAVGLITHSHAIGNERNNLFAAQYVFQKKTAKGSFNIGVQAGIHQLNFDAASLRITADTTKNNRKTVSFNPTDKKVVDLNAGISWTSKNFFIGASALHINEPAFFSVGDSVPAGNLRSDSTQSHITRTYNFMGGCNISLFRTLVEIRPMVFALTDLTNTRWQAALRAVYNKKYSVGASWRGSDGYSFFAGAVVEAVEIGYAYDWHTSGIGKESSGSHELSVRYRFPFELFSKKRMPYKSVRLL